MKVKVAGEEYVTLLWRVDMPEFEVDCLKEKYGCLLKTIDDRLEGFFENKVRTTVIKRDRDMILAEMKSEVSNNIFKGVE